MNLQLQTSLKRLRLSGLASTLEVRLQEAQTNQLSHQEFLELLLQDELALRDQRLLQRRLQAAHFREHKTQEDFQWDFNPALPRREVMELATCRFIEQGRGILFIGPPGTGNSHLAQPLGYQALKLGYSVLYRSIFDLVRDLAVDQALAGQDKLLERYLKPELLIIDDVGLKRIPPHSGEHLFEVIIRRHEVHSTIMTSNRPIEEWGKLLGDVPAAGAILDRFPQHPRSSPPPGAASGSRIRPRRRQPNHQPSRETPSPRRITDWLVLIRPQVAGFQPTGDTLHGDAGSPFRRRVLAMKPFER